MNRFIHLHVFLSLIVLFTAGRVSAQEEPLESAPNPTKRNGEPIVYVFPFEGEVELGLVQVFKRGFEDAERAQADAILVETDTPGGRVDAALEIIDIIMDTSIPVYIYVTGDATSAGAIISIAADGIYMKPGTTIGTAAPVMLGGGDSETMQEKTLSYIMAKVRSLCEQKGYSEEKTEIFMAMIDSSIEIADPENPDQYITRSGSLLTMTHNEALKYGIAAGIMDTQADVLASLDLPDAEVVVIQESDFERIARFFSSIPVSALLMTIAAIGLFWEFRTPGFGLPGLVGIIALALFFWGHLLAGLTGYEGILLFTLGLILVGLELFVIPGFGLTGIVGFLCMIIALMITLLDRPITSPHFWATFDWPLFYQSVLMTFFSILGGIAIVLFLPFLLPALFRSKVGSWLLLMEVEDKEQGYHSAQDGLNDLLGKIGLSKTPLRPSGIATIEGVRMDVVSQGGFIPPNTNIEVVKVEGRRVVVRQK